MRVRKNVVAALHSVDPISEMLESPDRSFDSKVSEAPPVGQALRLDDSFELRAQAAGADGHSHRLAAEVHHPLVDVGPEDAIGARRTAFPSPRVLVTDVPPVYGSFAADCAPGH